MAIFFTKERGDADPSTTITFLENPKGLVDARLIDIALQENKRAAIREAVIEGKTGKGARFKDGTRIRADMATPPTTVELYLKIENTETMHPVIAKLLPLISERSREMHKEIFQAAPNAPYVTLDIPQHFIRQALKIIGVAGEDIGLTEARAQSILAR